MKTWDAAIYGIIDDLERIVRPMDAQGNILPMATVDVGMTNQSVIKLALGALLVGVAISQANRKLGKRTRK